MSDRSYAYRMTDENERRGREPYLLNAGSWRTANLGQPIELPGSTSSEEAISEKIHRAIHLAGFTAVGYAVAWGSRSADLFIGERGVQLDSAHNRTARGRGVASAAVGIAILVALIVELNPLIRAGASLLLAVVVAAGAPLALALMFFLDSPWFQSDVVRVQLAPTDKQFRPLPGATVHITAARVRSRNLVTKYYGSYRVFDSVVDESQGAKWIEAVRSHLR